MSDGSGRVTECSTHPKVLPRAPRLLVRRFQSPQLAGAHYRAQQGFWGCRKTKNTPNTQAGRCHINRNPQFGLFLRPHSAGVPLPSRSTTRNYSTASLHATSYDIGGCEECCFPGLLSGHSPISHTCPRLSLYLPARPIAPPSATVLFAPPSSILSPEPPLHDANRDALLFDGARRLQEQLRGRIPARDQHLMGAQIDMAPPTNGVPRINGDGPLAHRLKMERKHSSPMAPAFMVSAPGKVIVWGEHAVVHGKVCPHSLLAAIHPPR